MSGEITGDFGALQNMAKQFNALLDDIFPKVQRAARDEAFDQYQLGFAQQRAPGGDRWAPKKFGDGPTLYKSGALSQGDVQIKAGGEVTVKAGAYYGTFHQSGWQTGGERVRVLVSESAQQFSRARKRVIKFGGQKQTIVEIVSFRKKKFKRVREGGKDTGPARPVLPKSGEAMLWGPPIEKAMQDAMSAQLSKL